MSLRSRIATVATLLVLAAIAVNTLLQTFAAIQAVRSQARVDAEPIAELLARTVAFAIEMSHGKGTGDALEGDSGLRRLVNEVVQGEVREVMILDEQLNPRVNRRAATEGASAGRVEMASEDLEMVRECIDETNAVGRLAGDGYRVAAPVLRADGNAAGAVLIEMSTASSRRVLWWQAAGAAVSAALVGIPGVLAAFWIARSIARPVRQAMHVAERIAAGDLSTAMPGEDSHEVGRLLSAMGTMSERLASLIGRIQSAGDRLSAVEGETADALARQDRAVRSFGESATDISTAVTEISTTSEQLLDATSEVTRAAREAADVADAGRGGLESMASSMQQLDEAMNAFTRKLSTISQRASGITSVVTTIAKVADQTNLLSVNATIEAEKAGESGRGFRIVAQEIRRLADQTALATKDIERMVRDMQAAVSSGTMEMDRFRNEVASRIAEVAGVSEQLGRIIEPVQSVTESLEHVHDGMKTQSRGARQISEAMETLLSGAGASAESLAVFSNSLDDLRQAIGELNREASQFRLAEQPVS